MFGTGLDDEGRRLDETLEVGSFGEGDRSGAGDLAADLAVDNGGAGGDRVEELDAHALFDAEPAAVDFSGDFPMAADDEITGAFRAGGQFAEDGQMVALEGDAGNDA